MDFTWEELSDDELAQAYADWESGKGLMGGDPRCRPNSDKVPAWGVGQPFFRTLALDDPDADNGAQLREALARSEWLEVEVGFGRGDFMLDRAKRHPDRLYIGYEIKTKASRLMLQRIERHGLKNMWISDDDVRFNMPRILPDDSIDLVHVLFPDPWWKDQHRSKRLFSPPLIDLLAQKIHSGGLLHFKSDVHEYGELVKYLIERNNAFQVSNAAISISIGEYAQTHREHWCQTHNQPVYSYLFERK